jgi:hypothetical protein
MPAPPAQSKRVSETSAGACATTGSTTRQAIAPAMEQWIDFVMRLSFGFLSKVAESLSKRRQKV